MVNPYLKEAIARGNRLLYEKKLSPGHDNGDVSIRDPETQYIYISPCPNRRLQIPDWSKSLPNDTVVIDMNGKIIDSAGLDPSPEYPMHVAIYKARPDINAIVHSHAKWTQMYAVTGKNVPAALAEQEYVLGGEIVCAEYAPVGTELLGQNIVNALGAHKMAAIMRNHGAVALGNTLEDAFFSSDYLETNCQVTILARLLGDVIPIKQDAVFGDGVLEQIDASEYDRANRYE